MKKPSAKKAERPSATAPVWRPVDWADYGVVRVMKGSYKGRLALYDDDASAKVAILYLDGAQAFSEGWVCITRKWLKRATAAEVRRYNELSHNDITEARAKRQRRQRTTE